MFLRTSTALLLCLLCACSTLDAGTKLDRAPAELRLPCPDPDKLAEDQPLLLGDLVQADADLAEQYLECQRRFAAWIKWEEGVLGGKK